MLRAPAPSDRRAFGRRESFIHAMAIIPGRAPEPCIVRNYSDTGALLEFRIPIEPAGRFRLVVEAKGIDAMCEVRRRTETAVGVSFVEEGAGLAFADETKTSPATISQEPPAATPPPVQHRRPTTRVPGHEIRMKLFGAAA